MTLAIPIVSFDGPTFEAECQIKRSPLHHSQPNYWDFSALRLSTATLHRLPEQVARPTYDREAIKPGIVHLGIGAFHRAHQAVVCDDLLAMGDMRWGVRGASLRSTAVRDTLAAQDGLYTMLVRDGREERARVIGSVVDVLVLPEDPGALIAALAHHDTHMVTLTVTEKGYRLDPASGALRLDDPDVAADARRSAPPRTVPGVLVAALAERRARGLPAPTLISCDNLEHNGWKLRAAVLAMASAWDAGLRDWIADQARFPQTMVDRIVPATTDADIAALAERLGMTDMAMVKTEPFTQWVVENSFAGQHPDLASVGVTLTDDVGSWEAAKLRLLNGAHSTIAYLGGLAAIEFVHEVVALKGVRGMVEALWDEAQTTLSPPPELDLPGYRDALMARFTNPALAHRTRQIAMDGSQKLPQRLVATAAERIAADLPIAAVALGIAGWMRWQEGRTDGGTSFAVEDPLADVTASALSGRSTSADRVAALLGLEAVFPRRLAEEPQFANAIAEQHRRLCEDGAAAILQG